MVLSPCRRAVFPSSAVPIVLWDTTTVIFCAGSQVWPREGNWRIRSVSLRSCQKGWAASCLGVLAAFAGETLLLGAGSRALDILSRFRVGRTMQPKIPYPLDACRILSGLGAHLGPRSVW